MLDENLPTFIVSPPDRSTHNSTISYTQYGAELTPAYTIHRPDPSLSGSKNRYAIALYDSFNPEILFAEVLLIPEWTQPKPTAEQIRLNGGVPPPPEPIIPSEFTIQLYNPDQQVVVRQKKEGTFTSTPTWAFEMPQQTFRQPSASSLDRTQNDPAASEVTPKVGFKWKKDGKFAKDLTCFLSGKTKNPDGTKKKNREPDITVAIFQHLKEVTLYEPNLQRIDLEDLKGFEVVLLLGAVVIRDVYFGHLNETFNISDPPRPGSTVPTTTTTTSTTAAPPLSSHRTNIAPTQPPRPSQTSPRPPRVPPTDPRSQWELDAETTRLRKQSELEERERKRRDAAEQAQIKQMLEEEEREKHRKQAEVDKETERLRRLYGREEEQAQAARLRPGQGRMGSGRHSVPNVPTIYEGARPNSVPQHSHNPPPPTFSPPQGTYQPYIGGPYLPGPNMPGASSSGFFPGPPSGSGSSGQQRPLREKKSSFFGFGGRARSGGGEDDFAGLSPGGGGERLSKKRSSLF